MCFEKKNASFESGSVIKFVFVLNPFYKWRIKNFSLQLQMKPNKKNRAKGKKCNLQELALTIALSLDSIADRIQPIVRIDLPYFKMRTVQISSLHIACSIKCSNRSLFHRKSLYWLSKILVYFIKLLKIHWAIQVS